MTLCEKKLCSGCGACFQACLHGCISMVEDEEGFLYPHVDEDKCVNCELCRRVCPVENLLIKREMDGQYPRAYGGWINDEEVRFSSSSGGGFTLFAKKILNEGGKVFGCALNENMTAVHIGVECYEELDKLRGSKYVQSTIGEIYKEIKECIGQGRKVLFAGTPCQAAGLYAFMGNRIYEDLYIVDFICHGVPSQKVFNEYIKYEERKHNSKLIHFKFRNKDRGWSSTGLQLGTYSKYEDGTEKRKYPAFRDVYMNGFLDDICLRPACYNCSFKEMPKKYADITIADFWGVKKVNSELDDKKGTSLIIVNTEKGNILWKQVRKDAVYKEVKYQDAAAHNKSLVKAAQMNRAREKFFEDFNNKGFEYVQKKYLTADKWVFHKIWKVFKSALSSSFR